MEKILYLIPCCKTKNKGRKHVKEQVFIKNHLSAEIYTKLP
jgi:hypothetical protein